MTKGDIDAILFDLGATLYESMNIAHATRTFLEDIGLDNLCDMEDIYCVKVLEEADVWLDEYMLKEGVDSYWEPNREVWVEYSKVVLKNMGVEDDLEHYAHKYQKSWEELPMDLRSHLLEHSKDTLHELHSRGYTLAVASNRFGDPSYYLERDEIIDYFSKIEYTAVPGYRKPSPYMLHKIARELEINPMRCAYVGNYVHYDVEAAIRADMKPVLVTKCNPEEADKASEGVVVIEDIKELQDIFS
jgi:HAD superfamily hydrolase (TIGR01549 family)